MEWIRGTKENPEIKLDVRADTDEVLEWIKEQNLEPEYEIEEVFNEIMEGNYEADISIVGEKYDETYLIVSLRNIPVVLISTIYSINI